MAAYAHEPCGFDGELVAVEVDIRRGIPAVDLVGLAEGAVREARDRVRAAVRNSGFEFPLERVLVNLAPAGLRKDGAAYDLPIATAILCRAGLLPEPGRDFLALGELRLDGTICRVRAVLPAVAAGLAAGIGHFIVPAENAEEALALGRGAVHGLRRLSELAIVLLDIREGREGERPPRGAPGPVRGVGADEGDFADIKGLARVRRALEIAAAGGHHALLFGPPGSGKTMVARRFPGILPDLEGRESIEVSILHSIVGILDHEGGLVLRPPFRSPHHGSSLEGLIGGGRRPGPGEVSLAHKGILFLDEAPEFHRDVLQALREPMEEGSVGIARAGSSVRFPAGFQLLLAANPCPCGNLGREGRVCLCGPADIARYWKRLGAPLLDRVDLRIPVRPLGERELLGPPGETSAAIRLRVRAAREIQAARSPGAGVLLNAALSPRQVAELCRLAPSTEELFVGAMRKLDLSSRAGHSVLKVARTIADLDGGRDIGDDDVLEAIQHRRYGDGNLYWMEG